MYGVVGHNNVFKRAARFSQLIARSNPVLNDDVDNPQASFVDSGNGTILSFEVPQVKHLPTKPQPTTVVYKDCSVTLDETVAPNTFGG